jgi:hypothetical protein
MGAVRETDKTQAMKAGPNPGLLRPPIIFLCAILLGIALNHNWPLYFLSPSVRLLGPLVTACAVVLFLLSYREIRRAGTSAQGSKRSTVIGEQVPTGSVAIPSIWHSSCWYSDCPFG